MQNTTQYTQNQITANLQQVLGALAVISQQAKANQANHAVILANLQAQHKANQTYLASIRG